MYKFFDRQILNCLFRYLTVHDAARLLRCSKGMAVVRSTILWSTLRKIYDDADDFVSAIVTHGDELFYFAHPILRFHNVVKQAFKSVNRTSWRGPWMTNVRPRPFNLTALSEQMQRRIIEELYPKSSHRRQRKIAHNVLKYGSTSMIQWYVRGHENKTVAKYLREFNQDYDHDQTNAKILLHGSKEDIINYLNEYKSYCFKNTMAFCDFDKLGIDEGLFITHTDFICKHLTIKQLRNVDSRTNEYRCINYSLVAANNNNIPLLENLLNEMKQFFMKDLKRNTTYIRYKIRGMYKSTYKIFIKHGMEAVIKPFIHPFDLRRWNR